MLDLATYQQPDRIRAALGKKRIAVVGLSNNPARPSHDVTRYMLDQNDGYTVIPVNPRETEILGATCYPDLLAAREEAGAIDMVNVFREAIAVGAAVLWLQLGVIHEEGIRLAESAGLNVVVDRCLKIEHARYRHR